METLVRFAVESEPFRQCKQDFWWGVTLTKNHLKRLKDLKQKKHREEQKKFLVEGIRLVQEAVGSDFEILEAFYTPDLTDHAGGPLLLDKLKEKTANVHEISSREMGSLSEAVCTQGVLAVAKQKEFPVGLILRENRGESVLAALDSVSDPGNVGTMIRTCDWFGVDGILLGGNSVELYNPKVIRATMGGIFHLPIAQRVDLLSTISKAKSMRYRIYVTDVRGETHFDRLSYDRKSLIVFGNEAWGVSDQLKRLADVRVLIRRYGAAESLNVSVACGVVLSMLHKLYDE